MTPGAAGMPAANTVAPAATFSGTVAEPLETVTVPQDVAVDEQVRSARMLEFEEGMAGRHRGVDHAGGDQGIAVAGSDDVVGVADHVQAVGARIDLRDVGADQVQGGGAGVAEVDDLDIADLGKPGHSPPSGRRAPPPAAGLSGPEPAPDPSAARRPRPVPA